MTAVGPLAAAAAAGVALALGDAMHAESHYLHFTATTAVAAAAAAAAAAGAAANGCSSV